MSFADKATITGKNHTIAAQAAEIERLTAFERVLSAAHDAAREDAKRLRDALEALLFAHVTRPKWSATVAAEANRKARAALAPQENTT